MYTSKLSDSNIYTKTPKSASFQEHQNLNPFRRSSRQCSYVKLLAFGVSAPDRIVFLCITIEYIYENVSGTYRSMVYSLERV